MQQRNKFRQAIVGGVILSLGVVVMIVSFQKHALTVASLHPVSHSAPSQTSRVYIDGSLAHIYTSLQELKKDSRMVVEGTIVLQKVVQDAKGIPSTISTIQVEKVLSSKTSVASKVLVRQPGGITSNGVPWINESFPILQVGSHYVLYLVASPDPTIFYTVGANQGVLVVASDNTLSSLSNQGFTIQKVSIKTLALV